MVWSVATGVLTSWPLPSTRQSNPVETMIALLTALSVLVAAHGVMMSNAEDQAASHAVGPGTHDAIAVPETLVAGYGGITHTHSSDVHFSKPGVTDLTAHGVDWIGRPFKSPIYYGIRAMHWPAGGRVGGMIDFTHAKAISVRDQTVRFSGTREGKPADRNARIGDTFRHLEFSHGHNMLTLNGLLSLARITPSLRPYAGAGLGLSLPHTEVQFLDEAKRTYEYQITGLVGQVVGGIEIRLPSASLLIEYKFSLAPYWVPLSARDGSKGNAFIDYWVQLSRWFRGEPPEAGTLTTLLGTHHLIVGVGYRHAPAAATAPPDRINR